MLRTFLAASAAFVLLASPSAAQSVAITHCEVVSADKSYSAAQVRPCTQTVGGRVRTDGVVGGPAADNAVASGNPVPVGGDVNTTRPTWANLDRAAAQFDIRGNLGVSLWGAGTATNVHVAAGADGASNADAGLYVSARASVYNNATWDRAHSVINGTDSNGTGIAAAGILAQVDDTTPTDPAENQFANLRMTDQRALHVAQTSTAAGSGLSLFTLTAANTTNATTVKASPGQVYGIEIGNESTTIPAWLSLYNTAGAPSCGTSIIQQFYVPATALGASVQFQFPVPREFTTGIGFCFTTGIAGTGAPAATDYVINITYR